MTCVSCITYSHSFICTRIEVSSVLSKFCFSLVLCFGLTRRGAYEATHIYMCRMEIRHWFVPLRRVTHAV